MARRTFTQVPYQYGDGKYGVAIGQTRDGVEELVTLSGQMVLDETTGLWVPVTTSNRLPVEATLSGSIPPIIQTLVSSPLTAGQSLTFGPFSLDNRPSGFLSYIANADTPIRVAVECVVGSQWATVASVVLDTGSPSVQIIPPFHPMSRQYRVRVENPTAMNQTRCSVVELYHTLYNPHPQNMRAVLVKNLAIRDTSTHTPNSDPQYIFRLNRMALGGGKFSISIENGLNQSLTVDIRLSVGLEATLGTTTVPAASRRLITNTDFSGLDVPSESVNLILLCSTAPTSGVVNAYVNTLVGGGA